MKKSEVKIGATYTAKVSGKVVRVRIDAENRQGGWNATNLTTKKKVRIKSARRLRAAADKSSTPSFKGKLAKEDKPVDPNRCATPRCKGEPVVTHVGNPLCQKCWNRQCAAKSGEAASAADTHDTKVAKDVAGDAAKDAAPGGDVKPKRAKKAAKTAADKPKRLSALDAAAQVLQKAGKPMRSQEMIAAMAEQGLWTSPAGKTPHATLYAAMLREINDKGTGARFKKVDRGQFEFNG